MKAHRFGAARWRLVTASGCLLALLLAPNLAWSQQPLKSQPAPAALAALATTPQLCEPYRLLPEMQVLVFDTALRAVVCHSSAYRQSPGQALQAQAGLRRARGLRQPALSLSTGVDGGRGTNTEASTALRADWTLFDFGASSAAVQEAQLGLQALQDEQRSELLSAAAQAAQLFTTAQAAIGRAQAAGINLRTAFDNSRAAAARHGAGAATLSDKLQAETALSQNKLEMARAMSQWAAARGALALAMGQAADWRFELAPYPENDADLPPPPNVQALMAEARERHPRIAGARGRLAQSQARVQAVQAQRWGSVSANANLGASTHLSRNNGHGSYGSGSAGVSWNLPLFLDRGVQRASEDEAQGLALLRRSGVEDSEREVSAQVWAEGQALLGEIDSVRASLAVLASADAALRAASERFRQGASSFSDVLSAQTSAANARFQWVGARAALARAQWRLAAAVGRFGDQPQR